MIIDNEDIKKINKYCPTITSIEILVIKAQVNKIIVEDPNFYPTN